VTANPWRRRLPRAKAASADTEGRIANTVASRGSRLVVSANAASLTNVVQGASEFDLYAWGFDVFFNQGPWVAEAEFDLFRENGDNATPDLDGEGWDKTRKTMRYDQHKSKTQQSY